MTDMSSRHESIKQMHAIQLHPTFTMVMTPQTMHRIIQHIFNKSLNCSIIKKFEVNQRFRLHLCCPRTVREAYREKTPFLNYFTKYIRFGMMW